MQNQNKSTYVNLLCSLFIQHKFVLLCLKAALEVCFCSRSCFISLKWLESVLTLSSKIANSVTNAMSDCAIIIPALTQWDGIDSGLRKCKVLAVSFIVRALHSPPPVSYDWCSNR